MKVTMEPITVLPPPRKFIIELTESEAQAVLAACMHHGGDARAGGTAELAQRLCELGVRMDIYTSRVRGACYLDRP